jgi:hypothetical protein
VPGGQRNDDVWIFGSLRRLPLEDGGEGIRANAHQDAREVQPVLVEDSRHDHAIFGRRAAVAKGMPAPKEEVPGMTAIAKRNAPDGPSLPPKFPTHHACVFFYIAE